MKIKLNHVTNSSSCSYITFIPPNADLVSLANENSECKEELNVKIKKILKQIPNQEHFVYGSDGEDESGKMYDDFHKMIWMLRKLEFPIFYLEMGSENQLYLMNIGGDKESVEKINRILMRYNF